MHTRQNKKQNACLQHELYFNEQRYIHAKALGHSTPVTQLNDANCISQRERLTRSLSVKINNGRAK